MLNMEYQFLKLYLLLYDLMVGSELFNDVDSSKLTKQSVYLKSLRSKTYKNVFIHNPMTFGFVVVTKSNNEWWPSWI